MSRVLVRNCELTSFNSDSEEISGQVRCDLLMIDITMKPQHMSSTPIASQLSDTHRGCSTKLLNNHLPSHA